MGRWLRGLVAFGLAAILAGCAAPPPPPPPTVVKLTLTASADVNPDPTGAAAPVVVRVYQLGSTSGFDAAEFFQIFNQDQATLKTDLIKRDDFLLAPGQTKTATLPPTDQVQGDRHLRRLSRLPDRHLARRCRGSAAQDNRRSPSPSTARAWS